MQKQPTQEIIEKLADDIIKYCETPKTREFRKAIEMGTHPLRHIIEDQIEYPENWPHATLELIFQITKKTESEEILAYVAAGPLQDVLNKHPDAVINEIETKARQDPRFRKCLTEVWPGNIPKDIQPRIVAACGNTERL